MTHDLTALSDAELAALFKETYSSRTQISRTGDKVPWWDVADEQFRRGSIDPLKIPVVREAWLRYKRASARIQKDLNCKESDTL